MQHNIIDIVSYFISCFCGAAILFDYMKKLLHKTKKDYIYWILQLCFSLIWFIVCLFGTPLINFVYFSLAALITGCIFFNAKHVRDIFEIEVFIISFAICDTTVSICISLLCGGFMPVYSNNSFLLLSNVILVQGLMLLINNILITFFKRSNRLSYHKNQFIQLALFPLLNIVIIYLTIVIGTNSIFFDPSFNLVIVLFIITPVLNITEILFYNHVSKSIQLKYNMSVMQQQMTMQYRYYRQLEIQNKNSQNLMHDIKNHIRIIERLYENNNIADGKSYTQKIVNIIDDNAQLFNCDNQILNIIINDKINICKNDSIEFIYSIENISFDFIDDIDTTTIFANLFDNAIEAAKKVPNNAAKIELRVYQYHQMTIINLINTIQYQPIKYGDSFVSSKKDHKAVGLMNVKTIVEKYDGDIQFEIEQNSFSVSIMFPTG